MNDSLMRWDCLFIGAGPAGMTAALYLLRFRRKVCLGNCGESRALLIPKSKNYPGFIKGISGQALLHRLKNHLLLYKLPILLEKITTVEPYHAGYISNEKYLSKTILLATGIKDIQPLPELATAVQEGLIRLCPVCDAYEVINTKIAIIGSGTAGYKEALFLRRYTSHISLITHGAANSFSEKQLEDLKLANIHIISDTIVQIKRSNTIYFHFKTGQAEFDTIYSALRCVENNELAKALGLALEEGKLTVDKFQKTSLEGVYAAGDIVSGLNQICVAQGQAALAASAINLFLTDTEK